MRKIIEHEYEHFAIDMVTNYQVYFPHNNSKRIIDMINQPYKYKKRDVKSPDSGRKRVEYNRSNTETLKKLKSASAAPNSKRGRSVFVKSRYSIWTAAKNTLTTTLKRKPTSGNTQISQLGMMASKNQALAGLIPNLIKLGTKTPTAPKTTETPYARRMSKSLGNLDALMTPVSVDPSPTFKPPRFLPQHTFEVEDSHDIQSSDLRFNKDSQDNVDKSFHRQESGFMPRNESGFKRGNTLSQKKAVKRGITLSPIMARREREDSWQQHSPADSQNDRFF